MVTTTKNQEKLRCKTKMNFTGIYMGKENIIIIILLFAMMMMMMMMRHFTHRKSKSVKWRSVLSLGVVHV